MGRLFMSYKYLNVVDFLTTNRACHGQLIVRKRGHLIRQIQSVMLWPFGWRHFHCTFSKHALRRWIEDEKIIVLVGDDDGIAHVRQNGAHDLVSAGELGGAARYFLLQLVPALAQCLLQFPLLGNVGVSPKPARNFALCIEDGKCTRKKPSVFTRFTPEWKCVLPRLAGCE